MIAADADHPGMPQAATFENGEIGRAAPDVDKCNPQLFLIRCEHGFARRELFDDGVHHGETGPIDAYHDVLRGSRPACYDVDVHLQTGAGHADRSADAVLIVDNEILREHMKDFSAGRQRHRLRRIDRPPHIVPRDFAVLSSNGDHASAVEPLDVRARDGDIDRVDFDAGHELGFLDGMLDGVDRRLEIDDSAAPNAPGFRDADTDDLEAAVVHRFRDDGGDFRGANINADQVPFSASQAPSFLPQSRLIRSACPSGSSPVRLSREAAPRSSSRA